MVKFHTHDHNQYVIHYCPHTLRASDIVCLYLKILKAMYVPAQLDVTNNTFAKFMFRWSSFIASGTSTSFGFLSHIQFDLYFISLYTIVTVEIDM